MTHRRGLRIVLFSCLVLAGGCGEDKLKGPEAEVRKSDVKLQIPPVPDFALPAAPGDGSHSVKEMRVKGKKLLDSDITVKGYVTWAYDCATAVREPGMDDKAVQKMIDEDPTKCERPKFYIGDAADTPAEKSMWVVDVPRPYNKLEMERIKKPDRNQPDRCEPNEKDPKKNICPPYKVGDQVEVTGTWKLSSPHSERNSDGLLVYKKMKNVTQNWESPELPPAPTGTPTGQDSGAPPAGSKPSPEDLVKQNKGKQG
ncbi:MAG TPA: hypothetical protein VFQ53_23930 [Kofleriaceae bacterium]|nr:hypothetical protein [Kofleriaceae bacterium]